METLVRLGSNRSGRRCAPIVVWAVVGLVLAGCGSLSKSLRVEPAARSPVDTRAEVDGSGGPAPAAAVSAGPAEVAGRAATAQAQPSLEPQDTTEELEQYDPWEPFNEKMFEFNLRVDRYVFKPVARVYRVIIPEPLQVLIANGFDNIGWVPRFVNSLLQGKWGGAGREVSRFVINSTAGLGGLFDPAKDYWGIRSSREDFGQTLGTWSNGPGPYLVLPLLPPMTVRDGIGRGLDSLLNPLSYLLPFFWERFGLTVGEMVNERALNYELFEGVEETTLDLYSSVRHFYLHRRERMIEE